MKLLHENEILHIITGTVKETVSGDLSTGGTTNKYKSLVPHGIEFLEDSIVIAHWKKIKQ